MTILAQLSDPHVDVEAVDDGSAEALAAGAHGAPFQYAARCGGVRLVVSDTTQPGRDDGRLDAGARAWLEDQLALEPGAPSIVAMHHAPFVTGITAMDALGLPPCDREALAALLARWPQVRRVVAGHVHRAAFGLLGGCPVFACPSTHLQVRLDPAGADVVLEPAPPAFALHALLDGGDMVTHVQPVTGA